MTSNSEVARGEVVKTRKNLGPSSKSRAKVNSARSTQMNEVSLKVATRSNASTAVRSTDSRQRKNLLYSGSKDQEVAGNTPLNKPHSGAGVRNLRAPLLGELGAADKETLEISKKKTQAQLAREKLAAAAAKKLHANSQTQARTDTGTARESPGSCPAGR